MTDKVERVPAVVEPTASRAVRRSSPGRSLVVGAADDALEAEADTVAADVLRRLQGRAGDSGPAGSFAGARSVRIARSTSAPAGSVPEVGREGGTISPGLAGRIRSAGGGEALSARTLQRMESGFAASFAGVRVHANSPLPGEMSAHAFTLGSDIHFAPGAYAPGGVAGERLLAHELTHVVQQGGAVARHVAPEEPSKIRRRTDGGPAASVRRDGPVVRRGFFDTIVEAISGLFSPSAPTTTTTTTPTTPKTLDEILRGGVDLHAGLDAALDAYPTTITIDVLSPFIEAASQGQRDAVWKDTALMTKAKRVLKLDDYLALLPALRVLTPPSSGTFPGAQSGYTGHTPAAEVDRLIGLHLGHYVADAKKAGRKAEGEISVVGGQDWEDAFNRQWPGFKSTMAAAFVDVDQPKRQIWLHQDRGDPGTAIHEGMHKYANDTIRNVQRGLYRKGMVQIGRLDEGLTEYFCRLVTSKLGISRTSYPNELGIATDLVAYVGEGVAAAAYFDGDFDRFIKAYLSTTKRTSAHWDLLSKVFEGDEDYPRARALLTSGAEV
jgi:hypothetical protein